jgi:glycine dehydrogenase subunit 2
MAQILEEARTTPDKVKGAPYTQPNRRFDEVRAARELDVVWQPAPDADEAVHQPG